MFGGPIDMTPYGALVKSIGVIYWLLLLGAFGLALWKPKRWPIKLLLSALVLMAGIGPVALDYRARAQQQAQAKGQLEAAMAHFQMRCKSAGEKIYRTVENVDGVVWMKWRPKWQDNDSQFSMDDPYGHDCGGETCIKLLLRGKREPRSGPERTAPFQRGYRYVESTDPADGKLYQYVMHLANGGLDQQALVRKPINMPTAQYGISWEDISTKEDREHWVAGSLLKVVDLRTGEVVGERIGYMLDGGLGARPGGGAPWLMAEQNACPAFERSGDSYSKWSRTTAFIFRALKPSKGE